MQRLVLGSEKDAVVVPARGRDSHYHTPPAEGWRVAADPGRVRLDGAQRTGRQGGREEMGVRPRVSRGAKAPVRAIVP